MHPISNSSVSWQQALDVPEAYFYAVDDELAELILQYHRFKKNNPGSTLILSGNI